MIRYILFPVRLSNYKLCLFVCFKKAQRLVFNDCFARHRCLIPDTLKPLISVARDFNERTSHSTMKSVLDLPGTNFSTTVFDNSRCSIPFISVTRPRHFPPFDSVCRPVRRVRHRLQASEAVAVRATQFAVELIFSRAESNVRRDR